MGRHTIELGPASALYLLGRTIFWRGSNATTYSCNSLLVFEFDTSPSHTNSFFFFIDNNFL
jgi:hypothetical protein